MRLHHIVAVFAVVACLSVASSALAGDPIGSCCNLATGACTEVPFSACPVDPGGESLFQSGISCPASGLCGACCGDFGALGNCQDRWTPGEEFCFIELLGTAYFEGEICNDSGSPCEEPPAPPDPDPMPTTSEWGMAAVMLLLLAGLTIKFGLLRSRKTA